MEKSLSKAEITCLLSKGINVTEFLGSGASGDVFAIAPYKGNEGLCMKYYYDFPHKAVEKEYERYRRLYYTEPSMFCRVFDLVWIDIPDEQFPDKNHHAAAMVMERLKPLDMSNQSINHIIKVLFDGLACLGYMHIIGIMHRDPKPDDIMYCERTGTYILIDYGISYESKGTFTEPKCTGTFYYLSPEGLRGVCSKRSDLFELGMVIREMLVGREFEVPDGEAKEVAEELYQIKKGLQPLNEAEFECPELIRIVNKLTRFDREERYHDYRAAMKDVIALLKSSNEIDLSKETRPSDRVLLIVVNDLYRAGMRVEEVSEIVKQKHLSGMRVIVFPVSDRLYMTADQNNKPKLFTPDKPSPFIKALNEQNERIVGLYKDYHFNPDIQLCVVGVSYKNQKRKHPCVRKKTPDICFTEQIMVDDTLADFGAMGIGSVALINKPDVLKKYLSDYRLSDTSNK
ncbi:MAG: hypothetical protein UIH27_15210 [Ruminococcus sp.]|nr:hypothetical protein [Ruminococcus sp.]